MEEGQRPRAADLRIEEWVLILVVMEEGQRPNDQVSFGLMPEVLILVVMEEGQRRSVAH